MKNLIALFLAASLLTGAPTAKPAAPAADPTLTVSAAVQTAAFGSVSRRSYALPNGDSAVIASAMARKAAVLPTLEHLTCAGGTLHLYRPGRGWSVSALSAGTYSGTLAVLDCTDGTSAASYLPQAWEPMANGSRRFRGFSGCLKVSRSGSGYEVVLSAVLIPAGCFADYTFVRSAKPLIDWSREGCLKLWASYGNDGDGRWCADGYFWLSPDTYVPSGKNVFHFRAASYLTKSFLAVAYAYRFADDLAPCMLEATALRQNAQGFFATPPESIWLSGDYGIGANFYDTRFNSDLMEQYVSAWKRYGFPQFRTVLAKYAAFYKTYAAQHHRQTANGWIPDDYYSPSGGKPTHASLNHVLAEVLAAWHAADCLGDKELSSLAGKILAGVTDLGPRWVRTDGNLHYGWYRDGSFGGQDYPCLTYNDLYAMQTELTSRRGGRDAALDALMRTKKAWMDKTGVTGYCK